jgi:hypothetical protein
MRFAKVLFALLGFKQLAAKSVIRYNIQLSIKVRVNHNGIESGDFRWDIANSISFVILLSRNVKW